MDGKETLPWGYDAPAKNTPRLDAFLEFITDPAIKPSVPEAIKNVLIYWDGGSPKTGDEAKIIEMGIDLQDKETYCARLCHPRQRHI